MFKEPKLDYLPKRPSKWDYGIGLIGVGLQPIYAIIISIAIYIGIRVIVGRQKKIISKSVGEGICVKCGERVINKKCPNCDNQKTEN